MKKGLTNNQLKIIALAAMTVDHIGVQLFPENVIFRIIGRLAFPIFAYMIAEGCKYTKNRKRYLGFIALEGVACQLVYIAAENSLYMNIFITFTMSIMIIFLGEKALKEKKTVYYALLALSVAVIYALCELLPKALPDTDFAVDYGFFGVLMPAVIYFAKDNRQTKLTAVFAMCVLLSISSSDLQYFSVFSVLPLALYNGERGKLRLKYFFYVYYPLHLAVIYLISFII